MKNSLPIGLFQSLHKGCTLSFAKAFLKKVFLVFGHLILSKPGVNYVVCSEQIC